MRKHVLLLSVLIVGLIGAAFMASKTASDCVVQRGAQQCSANEAPEMSTVAYSLVVLPLAVGVVVETGVLLCKVVKQKK